MAAKYAVSLMALLGSAAAQGYSNSSSIATGTTSSSASTYTNGAEPTVGGVKYEIQTDTAYQGTLLTLSRKRQATSDLNSCLRTCSASTMCVATSFIEDTKSCLYYSSIDSGSAASSPGTDTALVQSRATSSTTSSVFNGTTPVTSGSPSTGTSISSNYNNSTRSATTTGSASRTSSGSASSTTAAASKPSSLITIRGVLFLIEIDISYSGITIDFTILSKRAGETFDQCLSTCAANTNCAATSFTEGTCTFYSSVTDGTQRVVDGTDFATVISRQNAVGANNGTTPAGSSNVTAESLVCPKYNAGVIVSNVGVTFAVSCSHFLIGTTYDAVSTLTKRQAIDNGLPKTLSNCIDICSIASQCVGTVFDVESETCSYYSDVSYAMALNGFDSAVRVQDNTPAVSTTTVNGQVTTVTAAASTQTVIGATSTATVYVISTITVYAGAGVATTVVPQGVVTYVNPVTTISVPANAYSQQTVTVYANGAAPVQTVYVDQNGNVISGAAAGAGAGGAGAGGAGSYPTVTVYPACPATAAAAAQVTTWTTMYV